MKSHIPNVVIALILAEPAAQRKFAGFFSYLGGVHRWNLRILRAQDEINAFFRNADALSKTDGVIYSGQQDANVAKALASAACPVVVMEHEPPQLARRSRNLAVIRNDADEIAKCAMKTFAESGRYRTFAYVNDRIDYEWSRRREEAFRKAVAAKGLGEAKIYKPSGLDADADAKPLAEFLKNLEYPAAVLTVNDMRAAEVIAATKASGMKVPGMISLLGIDNDPYICDSVTPGISSIEPDFHAEGAAAAALLDKMMKSRKPLGTQHVFFGVSRVVVRESMPHLPPAQSLVDRAKEFIKVHAAEGITPGDVAAHLGVSRPLLDLRFRETQKTSVGRLITSAKLAEVARRRKATRISISAISDLCGFKNANALKNLFKKRYGMSMREYRTGGFIPKHICDAEGKGGSLRG